MIPRQIKVSNNPLDMSDDLVLSLPSNHAFNSSLASLCPRLTDAYLVTRVVQHISPRESYAHNLCSVLDD